MELAIVTGASRGLGRALAAWLLSANRVLLTISRHPDASLETEAAAQGAPLEQWSLDLMHGIGVAARLEAWLRRQDGERFAAATLVNNAALLGPAGPLQDADGEAIAAALRVGLEAPTLLVSAFLRATDGWRASKVLNISSGAAHVSIPGSAVYCAVKAGLDHFSRVLAEDEAARPNGAKIVALAPGVIDTDMQMELRNADPARFASQPRFLALKASGQLVSAEAAAVRVLSYLDRPDFGVNPVADVRNA